MLSLYLCDEFAIQMHNMVQMNNMVQMKTLFN